MKNSRFIFTITLLIVGAFSVFTSCQDKIYEEITYVANVPVYMDFAEFRASVKRQAPKTLVSPGKIYFYNNYLFINENQEGVHVIDNSNPSSPIFTAFIAIPGNIDISVRGNILYADSYIDMVAIDITDPQNPIEIDRIEGVFPNVIPQLNDAYPVYGLDFEKGVVVGWEKKEVTETIEKGTNYRAESLVFNPIGVPQLGSADVSLIGQNTGIGGSMARFTIVGSHLYAVHNSALKVFNISQTPGMALGTEVQLERTVETIYPFEGRLFLGTTTGMLVYSLDDPAMPSFVSVFEHVNSCDPVVVDGQFAYVTLRSGNNCNNMVNQLDVVDITSVENPFLVKSYPMYNPHGVGIDNKVLFVCDGDAGLKIYDATDPMEIHQHQLAHFPEVKSFDVIPFNGLLMMIGADGLYQYDYSNLTALTLLSRIPVTSKP